MNNTTNEASLEHPWSVPAEEVLSALDVERDEGLSEEEVKQRREEYGSNRLREAETRSAWEILIEQFKSLIVGLLVVAGIVSFIFGDLEEGIAIFVVVVINAAIGFVTELQAVRSMEALQELSTVDAKVRRGGLVEEIPAEKLVPGDIVVLESGDIVSADLRLLEASKLQANESALTGESVPVSKQVEPVEEDVEVADRNSMVYKGTSITRGSGEGIVVSTGMETELGEISTLVQEAEEEVTPLEKRLDALGRRLIWVTLGLAVLVAIAGILSGKEIRLMIETAVALAVASIPEGLPIVATVALARGMWRMARRNALINRLSAVETLGSTNVIITDKTGTLTENQMTVKRINLSCGNLTVEGEGLEPAGRFLRDGEAIDPTDTELVAQTLKVGMLANNANVNLDEDTDDDQEDVEAVGDPMEVALLVAGIKAGWRRQELLEELPEAREVAFDPEVKMMATFNRQNGDFYVAIKGSPEAVLEVSEHILTRDGTEPLDEQDREYWLEENTRMAAEGLRVLAMARRETGDLEGDPYTGLTFLGLVGLLDPPREEVRDSIQACQNAGIKVIMATGDQPVTARNVAQAVGLVEDNEAAVIRGRDFPETDGLSEEERERLLETRIFARVNPRQKLDLINVNQEAGNIVAMTGDGVNDAPALKKADIGVAMGERGTQVAREAADMVLQDDAFSSIVAAVEQGRVIFSNIRKFVLYLLSCNISEVMVVALASLINAPLPILPLQILFLNLVTDVFPALALGVGEGDPHVMERPPRDPQEPVMTKRHWVIMGGFGALMTTAVLGALFLALRAFGMAQERAVTISFLTLALAQLWHVFDMRDRGSDLLNNDVVRNPYVWGAVVLCVGLLLAAVYIPFLANLLSIVQPGLSGWGLILGMSLIPLVIGQVLKEIGVI